MEAAESIDAALRALADQNRRAILQVIRSGPQPVGAVAETVGLSQQTTSHHLRTLHNAVNTNGLAAVRSYLDEFWPDKLATLKSVIEQREAKDG